MSRSSGNMGNWEMLLGRAAAAVVLTLAGGGALAAEVTDPALKAAIERSQATKAAAEAAEAASDAEAAASAARAAAAKAELGPLADTKVGEGKVDLGANAGTFEAQLLSALATRDAAKEVAKGLGTTSKVDPIYILAGTEPLVFDVLDALYAKASGVRAALETACPRAAPTGETIARTAALPAIGTAVDLVARLFRTDTTFNPLTVAVDQPLLVQAVAGALRKAEFTDVRIPGAIAAASMLAENPAVATVTALNGLRPAVEACLATAKKPKTPNAAQVARIEAALKRHDDFLTVITAPAANGAVELAVAARQADLAKAIRDSNVRVLRVSMHSAGGSIYARKNFWTAFGMGMPVRVSGGTIVSWNLSQPLTGEVDEAGTAALSSGYHGVSSLHACLRAGKTSCTTMAAR